MIEVERRALLAAMKFAGTAIERRNSIPVLDAMHVHANGRLALCGTDLDMEARAAVPFTGKPAAPFLFEAPRALAHALGHAGGDVVRITPEASGLRSIVSGQMTLREKGNHDVDNWPRIGAAQVEAFGATLSGDHVQAIARVISAVSTEETRYYLNGVFVHHLDGWNYRAVATDGHRLMCAEFALPDATGALAGVIIPRRAVRVLVDHFAKAETIALRVGAPQLANETPATTAPEARPIRAMFSARVGGAELQLTTKLIDGTYPDYKRVIPQTADAQIVVDIAALRGAVQALSPGGTRTPVVKLTVAQLGVLEVSSAMLHGDVSAAITIPVETNCRQGWAVGFNGRYLLDVLAALRGDQVVIASNPDPAQSLSNPAIIRDPSDAALTAVLMPMRF